MAPAGKHPQRLRSARSLFTAQAPDECLLGCGIPGIIVAASVSLALSPCTLCSEAARESDNSTSLSTRRIMHWEKFIIRTSFKLYRIKFLGECNTHNYKRSRR
jgi:hypothetical protein